MPANGWLEWQRTGHGKQPFFLALADGSALADIHDRQPAIIDSDLFDDWLDPMSPVPQFLDGWPNCNGSARVTSQRRLQYGMDNVPS